MGGLEDILFGRQPADSFLQLFPPVNIQASPSSSSSSSWHMLDFEGFVFLLHPTNDYSKIKTPIYYIAHKFRASNIAEIMSLADGSPQPTTSHSSFSGNSQQRWTDVANKIFPCVRNVKVDNPCSLSCVVLYILTQLLLWSATSCFSGR